MSNSAEQETSTEAVGQQPIAFADFLEGTGSSQFVQVSDLWEKEPGSSRAILSTPELLIHCPSDTCNGSRIFRFLRGDRSFSGEDLETLSTYLTYRCSNCRNTHKIFSLQATRAAARGGSVYKDGEEPAFGPPTPTRLLRLFGKDREIFLKGRQCEIHGLGIGAFVYYRRVVENHKNQIIDEIIKVARKVGAPDGTVESLENAKSEIQFSKGVKAIKVAIPQALLIDGQNPLTLLHSALSSGVHDLTDEECLQLAHDVRLLLAELAERITAALADQAELKTAVGRLLNAGKDSGPGNQAQ